MYKRKIPPSTEIDGDPEAEEVHLLAAPVPLNEGIECADPLSDDADACCDRPKEKLPHNRSGATLQLS